MLPEDYISYPSMLDSYVEGETLWFSNVCVNALMRISLLTGELLFFHVFKDYPFDARSIHQTIFKSGNKLILCPDVGSDRLIILDMDTGEERSILFGHAIIIKNGFIINGELWLFPTRFNMGAYILNLETFALRRWEKFCDIEAGCSTVLCGNRIFSLKAESNVLLEYKDNTSLEHTLDFGSKKFIPMEAGDGQLIVGESDGFDLFAVNTDSWQYKKIYTGEKADTADRFMRIRCSGEWILCVKRHGLSALLVNTRTGETATVPMPEDYMISNRIGFPFYFRGVAVWQNKFLILPIVGKQIIIVEPETGKIGELRVHMSKSWEERCYKFNAEQYQSIHLLAESNDFSIDGFLKMVRYMQ